MSFIALMMAQNPFPEIVDHARRASVLERLQAILSNAAFVRWLTAVQTANGGITAASKKKSTGYDGTQRGQDVFPVGAQDFTENVLGAGV